MKIYWVLFHIFLHLNHIFNLPVCTWKLSITYPLYCTSKHILNCSANFSNWISYTIGWHTVISWTAWWLDREMHISFLFFTWTYVKEVQKALENTRWGEDSDFKVIFRKQSYFPFFYFFIWWARPVASHRDVCTWMNRAFCCPCRWHHAGCSRFRGSAEESLCSIKPQIMRSLTLGSNSE